MDHAEVDGATESRRWVARHRQTASPTGRVPHFYNGKVLLICAHCRQKRTVLIRDFSCLRILAVAAQCAQLILRKCAIPLLVASCRLHPAHHLSASVGNANRRKESPWSTVPGRPTGTWALRCRTPRSELRTRHPGVPIGSPAVRVGRSPGSRRRRSPSGGVFDQPEPLCSLRRRTEADQRAQRAAAVRPLRGARPEVHCRSLRWTGPLPSQAALAGR